MLEQGCLDFTQFNPLAANLNLIVVASQKFQGAIRQPACPIASPIHSGFRCASEWIRQKTFPRQLGPVQISARHLHTAEE